MTDLFLSGVHRSAFDQADQPSVTSAESVKKLLSDSTLGSAVFVEKSATSPMLPFNERPLGTMPLPRVDFDARQLLDDFSKKRVVAENIGYSPTGYSPKERLSFVNKLAAEILSNYSEIDTNENDALSKRELSQESLSKFTSFSPEASKYFLDNYDSLIMLNNDDMHLYPDGVLETNKLGISPADLSVLKVLTGTEAELLDYARDTNLKREGGAVLVAGTAITFFMGCVGSDISRRMGLLGVGVGVAGTALAWTLTLNEKRNMLEAKRKDLSMDPSIDRMIRSLEKKN